MTKQAIENFSLDQLTFEPLSENNWSKFEDLFGQKGACGNCWCMSFRLKKSDFENGKINDGNKNSMHTLVREKLPTGILAIYNRRAIAWAALAPREVFVKIENSRIHKRIDNKQVWSIPCTFIDKKFRRMGVSVKFLQGIIQYAKNQGINIIEAYPTIPTAGKLPDAFAWVGLYKSFERSGFQIVDQTSKNRPMVRYYIDKN